MVFTKLLLENGVAIRPCNCEAVTEPLLPKVARCIPVPPSRYIGKCAARVLKYSDCTLEDLTSLSTRLAATFCNDDKRLRTNVLQRLSPDAPSEGNSVFSCHLPEQCGCTREISLLGLFSQHKYLSSDNDLMYAYPFDVNSFVTRVTKLT